ncbi:MAG: serine protein kinase RIO [Nitrococcus sp.]|nr:serine protein kinase RIO [Nitrococcus sp.]
MRIPRSIEPLVRDGLVDKVIRSLKSGKEATVYMVLSEGEVRCAKVYKDADKRSFHQQAQYQEGRKVRNSRRARAMAKRTRYGRREQEAAWQSAEVDALFRLSAAGVRVPKPYGCVEGVLLMELIVDDHGDVAPRLNDLELTAAQARAYHGMLIAQIVRMLCAGLIHGDLSEYNVLVGSDGPVIIDLPQAVDAAGNNNACRMLERDVDNLTSYFSHSAPELGGTDYGKEIWALYESGALHPQIELTGRFERSATPADVTSVLQEIEAVREEADKRRRDRATSMIEIDG